MLRQGKFGSLAIVLTALVFGVGAGALAGGCGEERGSVEVEGGTTGSTAGTTGTTGTTTTP